MHKQGEEIGCGTSGKLFLDLKKGLISGHLHRCCHLHGMPGIVAATFVGQKPA